jgi:hypothetical protein
MKLETIKACVRFFFVSVGWAVDQRADGSQVVTDLHGCRWRITVAPCD